MRNLEPLSSLDGYRMAADEPDIRGWQLLSRSGERLGTVDELLVDPDSAEVGALAVSLARDDRKVALPIEDVHVDPARRAAVLERESVRELRPLGEQTSPRGSASDANTAQDANTAVTVERGADGEEVVKVPIVEERLVVERRPVVKEVLLIRKRAVEDTRTIEADLRKERAEVNRKGSARRTERSAEDER
jgi:sporulation protein YlmC with PRC-barrel domain